jgi:exodeoxyribonuclease V alpha subunit
MDITGKVKIIVFSNREAGFYIFKIREGNNGKVITAKGTFPGVDLNTGLTVKLTGDYVNHSKFGRQFAVSACEVLPEKGRSGIVAYLSSHVKSIGPITAGKLYDAFGDDLVTILENEPERVLELSFLNKTQSKAIIEEWKESSEVRTTAIFLTDLGLNATQIKQAFKQFGKLTKSIVKDNPYSLFDCHSIGFQTADVAARKLGIGVDDPRRIRAVILYILTELSRSEGHMFCTSDQIKDYAQKMFKRGSIEPFSQGGFVSDITLLSTLSSLKDDEDIVYYGNRIYLIDNWLHESYSAECLARALSQDPYPLGNLRESLARFEDTKGLVLSDEQRQAFLMLGEARVCVISGFPGTGKTLLISALVHLFEENNLHYTLLSPTGIAAKRQSQMTGRPASTIHRALGCKRDGTWEFDRSNKYYVDAVIVDETSMVDGLTFYRLISALPSSALIVLVGDPAQLPSVGAGHVLHNLMKSQFIPNVSLTQIYRQEEQSDIIEVAHSILAGELIDTSFNDESEFLFLQFDKDEILGELCKLTTLMKKKKTNFQVIAPMYDGDLGVNNLNSKLREVLNTEFVRGNASKVKHGVCDLYEGDRVMIVKNDYDRMVFNGDVGKVRRISIKKNEVEVRVFDWFDHGASVPRYVDKNFIFTLEEARALLKVAFACTAHKVQGQEFDYVLLPMTLSYRHMLYRNLLYTAITRAKKKVFVFGDPRAFHCAVSNNRETIRNSALIDLIQESCS